MIKKFKELHYINYVAFSRLSEKIYKYILKKRERRMSFVSLCILFFRTKARKKCLKNRLLLRALTKNFTFAKFIGAVVTIIAVSLIKYLISGDFHLKYSEFWSNVAVGFFG